MSWSRALLLWLAAFLLLFPINGLVHVGPGAPLFDHALAGVASAAPMRQGSPLLAALIDLNIAGAMVLFLLRGTRRRIADGALVGAVLGLVAAGTWNLANLIVVRGWPASVAIGDVVWHVALGAAAGALLALVAARAERRAATT
jgi:Predicted membrane protein (DUF2177)